MARHDHCPVGGEPCQSMCDAEKAARARLEKAP